MPPTIPTILSVQEKIQNSLLSPRKQGIILCAWDQVQATSPRHLIKHEGVRSTTPVYHWGVWEVTASRPYITMESHQQTPEAILSIDNLLDMVKKHVVAKIIKVTKEYLPNQWIRQERQVDLTPFQVTKENAEY
ncbi:hypothetical protein L208DRAFT_1383133, partial [Tricholoma matsutake]